MTTIPTIRDDEFAVDAAAIALVSLAIMTLSQHILVMTILVCTVLLARSVAWTLVNRGTGARLSHDLLFFALCLGIGAFNDWNSVVNHEIYSYTVPSSVAWSTIPVWMLLFWGMILRFVATLCRWHRLHPPKTVTNAVRLLGNKTYHSPWLRVGLLLAVVAITRQLIYRFHGHPVLSWLPFAIALLFVLFALRPTRHDRTLITLFLIGGPLVEVAYIELGQLHYYELGWLGGVPIWIALWWVLSVLIWKELSGRLLSKLAQTT